MSDLVGGDEAEADEAFEGVMEVVRDRFGY
jgi:hypothetical protein